MFNYESKIWDSWFLKDKIYKSLTVTAISTDFGIYVIRLFHSLHLSTKFNYGKTAKILNKFYNFLFKSYNWFQFNISNYNVLTFLIFC